VAERNATPPPITKPLWRSKPVTRWQAIQPFVGRRVRLDRWGGRVAAHGDWQYTGLVIATAISTIGSSADLLILRSDGGTTWAISLAQIAFMEAL